MPSARPELQARDTPSSFIQSFCKYPLFLFNPYFTSGLQRSGGGDAVEFADATDGHAVANAQGGDRIAFGYGMVNGSAFQVRAGGFLIG